MCVCVCVTRATYVYRGPSCLIISSPGPERARQLSPQQSWAGSHLSVHVIELDAHLDRAMSWLNTIAGLTETERKEGLGCAHLVIGSLATDPVFRIETIKQVFIRERVVPANATEEIKV